MNGWKLPLAISAAIVYVVVVGTLNYTYSHDTHQTRAWGNTVVATFWTLAISAVGTAILAWCIRLGISSIRRLRGR